MYKVQINLKINLKIQEHDTDSRLIETIATVTET